MPESGSGARGFGDPHGFPMIFLAQEANVYRNGDDYVARSEWILHFGGQRPTMPLNVLPKPRIEHQRNEMLPNSGPLQN